MSLLMVVRSLADLPPVLTDKHKTLMILVNLVSNTEYGLEGVLPAERVLFMKMEHDDSKRVRIQVRDNGMGIALEPLTRISGHGATFTLELPYVPAQEAA